MKTIYTGKTKDVFEQPDGNYLLVFKDDVTGVDGKFDPGANTVGLRLDGAGMAGLSMSVYYFELLNKRGIPTHFISAEKNEMVVKPAVIFGNGIEVICRYKAFGSFIKRYGDYIKEGASLNAVVEITLKDDKRGDPLINEDSIVAIDVLKYGEYAELKMFMKIAGDVIKNDLKEKGLELCDIKLEFGKDLKGNLMLIDEISGGNMRVTKNGAPVDPIELSKLVLN
ncbi:MAG: phosphoribosylaminoimidazolesuccinocarboxamide synthase [Oscillospiraceae bacterium]|nr:phosphoribosylaminoimidazolesuccinocarboxamide synthase [Oscillospiraceae bacterium]